MLSARIDLWLCCRQAPQCGECSGQCRTGVAVALGAAQRFGAAKTPAGTGEADQEESHRGGSGLIVTGRGGWGGGG